MPDNSEDYGIYRNAIAQATKAAKAYYDTDVEIMSDSEYDRLIEVIEFYEEKHGWNEAEALLTKVAAGVSDAGDVTHVRRMLSLGKVKTFDEVSAFVKGMERKMGNPVPVILEPKLDGLAISAKYVNGVLVQVAKRGNGYAGEDITTRLPEVVKGLPKRIGYTDAEIEVRGEVYITEDDFRIANMNRIKFELAKWAKKNAFAPLTKDQLVSIAKFVKDHPTGTETPVIPGKVPFAVKNHVFSNSRNAVSGALHRDTADFVVPMSFAAYDSFFEGNVFNHDQSQVILSKLGFGTASNLIPAAIRKLPLEEAIEAFGKVRSAQQYPTDGVVIKAVSAETRKALGNGSKNPRWAVAYKYPADYAQTVVKGIELSIGRTGRLSLRAKVTPVLVEGTVINYASLHNVSWLEEKDIRVGDTVAIKRANNVIPYIERVILSERPVEATKWVAPENCPKCGKAWDKTTLLWRCDSDECGNLNGIIHAAGRDYFDWEGLSEAIITRLNETGLVDDIADIFLLTKEDLATLDMGRVNQDNQPILLGEKTAEKLYEQIQASKQRPLHAVLASLGIRSLGRSVGRWLEENYGTMDKILSLTPTQLTSVEGIALKKAQLIHDGLQEKREIIAQLAQRGVNMGTPRRAAREPVRNDRPLAGLRVCVTGSVPGYTRTQVQDLLRNQGATSASSVSSRVNLLVADPDATNTTKYQTAVRLGTRIISPADFLGMIR